MTNQIELRYGMNPHQQRARVFINTGALPITVLNGQPGYINLLDALNAWQLVRELSTATQMATAASFKHVSPAGAAVGEPLNDVLRQIYFVGDGELSPLATAYARARGADRLSSFGDWIALSGTVDVPTANLIRREVSDGVIAPAYEPAALEILRKKKQGSYRVIQIDAEYVPDETTTRELFGITFEQQRNDHVPTSADLTQIVTQNKTLPDHAIRDMLVALIALKYTQSNSVAFVKEGQIIGMGAGQQSRIHCTRLAATKADTWWLRQHPRVLALPFAEKIGRAERDNAIDQFLLEAQSSAEESHWLQTFRQPPMRLTAAEKRAWLAQLSDVTLGSDAFFPFRDNIDRAAQSGVRYVVQPGGSVRDDVVIEACNGYGMTMVFNGVRLFHH
jgi:AICAR transformylase/IMP cyclohydrolase PurH